MAHDGTLPHGCTRKGLAEESARPPSAALTMIGLRACHIAWFASHEKTWEFSLGSNINETLLLHGANYANAGPIAAQGFDDRLAGRELHAPSIVE